LGFPPEYIEQLRNLYIATEERPNNIEVRDYWGSYFEGYTMKVS
jgi:hypothetical protein